MSTVGNDCKRYHNYVVRIKGYNVASGNQIVAAIGEKTTGPEESMIAIRYPWQTCAEAVSSLGKVARLWSKILIDIIRRNRERKARSRYGEEKDLNKAEGPR